MQPPRGLGIHAVDHLDQPAFGIRQPRLHHGDDHLAGREAGLHLGHRVKDEVVVGTGGDQAGVQDQRLALLGCGQAGAGEHVREQRTGVAIIRVAVRVVDLQRDLRKLQQVLDRERRDAALEGDIDRMRGRDGRLDGHVVVGRLLLGR